MRNLLAYHRTLPVDETTATWSPGGTRRRPRCLPVLIVAVLLVGACSSPGGPAAQDSTTVITWGSTGIIYESQHDNLRMMRNFLAALGAGHAVEGDLRILYSSACDPRTDPGLCQLAAEFATLEPFFEMIAGLGTIHFAMPSTVALDEYSLAILDFCHGAGHPSQTPIITTYLQSGGRALILGDNFCYPLGQTGPSSAAIAGTIVGPLGITFTDLDPAEPDPLTVSLQDRTGLLVDVATVDVWRVAPQVIAHTFEPVLESRLGVLAARLGR